MSILSKMKSVKEKLVEVPEHPLANRDTELRFIYLAGLAMTMAVDGEIKPAEKSHLEYMIRSFRMPESSIDRLLSIGDNLSEDQVEQLVNTLKENELEYAFLIDAALMASKDGESQPEEEEFMAILVEMLGLPASQQEFLVKFALATGKKNSKALNELMTNTKGIDKNFLNPYLEEAGLIFSRSIHKGEKIVKGKTLQLSGEILLEVGATLCFDSCDLSFVNCNLLSSGKLQMKDCTVTLDGTSQLSLKDLELSGSTFGGIGKLGNNGKAVAFSLTGAENVIMRDCQFNNVPYETIFSILKTKAVTVQNCTFRENGRCINFDDVAYLEVANSVFKGNIAEDLSWRTCLIPDHHIKSCLFDKTNNSVNTTRNAVSVGCTSGECYRFLMDCQFISCKPFHGGVIMKAINCVYS